MKGTDINESIITCCNILGIDVESLSEGVRKSMEDSMKLNKEKKVLSTHNGTLPSPDRFDGQKRIKVYVPDPHKAENRKQIYAYSYDEMIDKLYEHYFNKALVFENVFKEMCDHLLAVGKPRPKTITEYKNSFKMFFEGEPIIKKRITDITTKDWESFLAKAHHKITDLDKERGQTCIEKHRHYEIVTIINRIFRYAHLENPFVTNEIDAADYPFYDHTLLESDGYTREDVKKLLDVFDSIKKPTIPQLVNGLIFETLVRIGEARALRFEDFHMDAEKPYIRICGLANESHREERVKRDSKSGKRNLAITPRLERIYELGKDLSWSDKFIFVKEREYVTDEDIANDNVCVTDDAVRRALKTMCKKAGIKYFPPHQFRFYGAMEMVNECDDIYAVSHYLGHTNLKTTQHYIDKLNRERVFDGLVRCS